jgi:hypothetical protein
MTFSRSALVLVAGAALLAACSQPAGNTSTTTAASGAPAAAAATGPDTVISQADLPHPKAGLWATSSSMNGAPPSIHQTCYKGEPIKMNEHPIPGCTGLVLKRTFLGDYVMDAACAMHGMDSSMHVVVHGDFMGGAYTSDGKAHIVMPGRPPMDFTTHTEAHWVGPC